MRNLVVVEHPQHQPQAGANNQNGCVAAAAAFFAAVAACSTFAEPPWAHGGQRSSVLFLNTGGGGDQLNKITAPLTVLRLEAHRHLSGVCSPCVSNEQRTGSDKSRSPIIHLPSLASSCVAERGRARRSVAEASLAADCFLKSEGGEKERAGWPEAGGGPRGARALLPSRGAPRTGASAGRGAE